MSGRVFITQVPSKRSPEHGWVPTINISPAEAFGECIVMLPPQAAFMSSRQITQELNKKLADFTHEDCLLPVGDPLIMAAASAIAARRANGRLNILRWDRQTSSYSKFELEGLQ